MAQCVILNASHEPLALVNAQRGLVLCLEGKATVLDAHPVRKFRSPRQEFPVPIRIILKDYVPLGSRYYVPAQLNNDNLFLRDDETCQYCGRTRAELPRKMRLTRDHVLPTSRGGKDAWDNVVTACGACNHQKDARTPEEAGLTLRVKPRVPLVYEILLKRDELHTG